MLNHAKLMPGRDRRGVQQRADGIYTWVAQTLEQDVGQIAGEDDAGSVNEATMCVTDSVTLAMTTRRALVSSAQVKCT